MRLLLTAGLVAGFFMPANAQPVFGDRDEILIGKAGEYL